MNELPDGWARAPISELTAAGLFTDGDWVESKDQDPEGSIRLLQLADVGEGVFRDRSSRYLNDDAADRLGVTYVHPSDVLVARMPDPIGRACLAPAVGQRCITVVDVCILRPGREIDSRWLMWALNSPRVHSAIAGMATGTTRKRISRKNLATIELGVPPLPEQRRIVAAIDEYFSRLDAADASLQRSAKQLAKFGRRLLASLLDVPFAPSLDTEEPTEQLPEGWNWRRAGDVCDGVVSGSTPQASDMIQGVGEVPFIKVYNLQFDGHLDFTIKPTFVSPETHASKLKRSRVVPGDVLTNIVGPPLGKISVVPATYSEWNINQAIAAFKPSPELDGSFLSKLLLADVVMRPLLRTGKATAGQINLSISSCRRLWLPIPPLSEQRRLVPEIDSSMAVCDSLLVDTQKAATRAAALRRSILAAAFSGRLVTQDPSDEPAAVLLERIAAERAASKPSRKTKSTS